jgi:hypothetical protein
VYTDAVGDLSLVTVKWGPSISHFQIRSLRNPGQFSTPDSLRVASKLRDPLYATKTAKAIHDRVGWSAWSAYTSGLYLPHKGKDMDLRTGHPRAGDWNQ